MAQLGLDSLMVVDYAVVMAVDVHIHRRLVAVVVESWAELMVVHRY